MEESDNAKNVCLSLCSSVSASVWDMVTALPQREKVPAPREDTTSTLSNQVPDMVQVLSKIEKMPAPSPIVHTTSALPRLKETMLTSIPGMKTYPATLTIQEKVPGLSHRKVEIASFISRNSGLPEAPHKVLADNTSQSLDPDTQMFLRPFLHQEFNVWSIM